MSDGKPGPARLRDESSADCMVPMVVSSVRDFGDKRMAADWLQKLVADGIVSADMLATMMSAEADIAALLAASA